jgi:SNF2 family DNA or RNA helicase
MLTGTPIYNRPYDLYPVLSVLFRKQLGQYWDEERFRYRYCGGSLGLGSSHENELNEKLSAIMLRRTKAEVLPELDPVTREVILLPAETAIMKDIIKIKKKYFFYLIQVFIKDQLSILMKKTTDIIYMYLQMIKIMQEAF